MKKPEYKSTKWDIKKEVIRKNRYLENKINEINEIENKFNANEYDAIKYCLLMSTNYEVICGYEYILNKNENVFISINNAYEKLKEAYELYNKGISTTKAIERIMKKDKKGTIMLCYAVILNKFESVKNMVRKDNVFFMFFNREYANVEKKCKMLLESDSDNEILKMMIAICNKNEKEMQFLIYQRVKKIRKQASESMVYIDIWLTALLKIAKEQGLNFDCDFIEVLKDMV